MAHDITEEALREGGTVAIAGFGTFKVARQAARTGRNPRTGSLSFFSDRRK
jgi:DNA-binding protein HU-beta